MPGPPPKDPATRARRNKAATAAELPAEGTGPKIRVPLLPKRRVPTGQKDEGGHEVLRESPWHPSIKAWWRDVWRSPMAVRFLKADVHGLLMLAELRDQFARAPTVALAGEIRLQEKRWGLDTMARWGLQWSIAGDALTKPQPAAPRQWAPAPPAEDPRKVLAMPMVKR